MLYLYVYKTKNFSFQAFHMISSKQDAQTITDFLAHIEKRILCASGTETRFSVTAESNGM